MKNTTPDTAKVDHSWLPNVCRCAFDRMYLKPNFATGERCQNAHILNRYRIRAGLHRCA